MAIFRFIWITCLCVIWFSAFLISLLFIYIVFFFQLFIFIFFIIKLLFLTWSYHGSKFFCMGVICRSMVAVNKPTISGGRWDVGFSLKWHKVGLKSDFYDFLTFLTLFTTLFIFLGTTFIRVWPKKDPPFLY